MADPGPSADDYLTPEARARVAIDRMLVAAGWAVQNYSAVNLTASKGIAVREFVMKLRTAAPTICCFSTAAPPAPSRRSRPGRR